MTKTVTETVTIVRPSGQPVLCPACLSTVIERKGMVHPLQCINALCGESWESEAERLDVWKYVSSIPGTNAYEYLHESDRYLNGADHQVRSNAQG